MIRILSHTSFPIPVAATDVRPRACAWMADTGLTVGKDANPDALVLRHAP